MELNRHGRRIEKYKEEHAVSIKRKEGLNKAAKDRSALRLQKELKKRTKTL